MKRQILKKLTTSVLLVSLTMSLGTFNSYSKGKMKLTQNYLQDEIPASMIENKPIIFPAPQKLSIDDGNFGLNQETVIIVPQDVSEDDQKLAMFLVKDLSDKYDLALKIKESSKLPDSNYIIMGTLNNSLVSEYCRLKNINITNDNPGTEGYILKVNNNSVVIVGSDPQGAFYGLQSLRQLIYYGNGTNISCVNVRDWPEMPFRGIKLYIPGRDNIPFFKRFISDFMALYKFNKVIIEVNAVMRFDSHPELNAGWVEFARELDYSRRNNAVGPKGYYQNSNHRDAGDGGILEKKEVSDLVEFSNEHYIEVIPEIPTLTHTYYLLTRHRELADVQDSEWPSTYCPSNPETYDLLFDVFDEYIDVMKPKMIHIGRDEWWGAPIDYCPRCRGKDYLEMFAQDLNKIYDYLAKKDIKVAMWGDHLLENVRKKGVINRKYFTGEKYQTPGALPLTMVKEKIPKDILIFNWFYGDQQNDYTLEELGFKQVYGNMLPSIENWDQRKKLTGMIGGAPSSWAATTEFNFGKDLTGFFLGCANLLWSKKEPLTPNEHFETIQQLMPSIHRNLDRLRYPSETGDPVVPIDIHSYFNESSEDKLFGVDFSTLKTGIIANDFQKFQLPGKLSGSGKKVITVGTLGEKALDLVQEVKGIKINEDVSSLIFLHTCALKANNEKAYRKIYNFDDTSDLLGWYEIVYEDDFVETIPIRYGYNILEWNIRKSENYLEWYDRGQGSSQDRYCYKADAVDCSDDMHENPINFFAFEWINKRFGKKIKEVNIKGTSNYMNSQNKVIENNAIMLAAISVVKKREVPVIEPHK